ncbi:hypothetical protein ABTZ58_37045 [Streptomyces sp. NPDC094143]|uniref:hypothetical protein n=1 Tax=Streptomyces sp. NPDC094143 TaxID=3155310 RepID=UPI00332A1FBA
MAAHDRTEPAEPTAEKPAPSRLQALRNQWHAAWEEGGFLHQRWEDLAQARHAGWHDIANWIKAVLVLAGVCAVIILLDTASDIVSAVLHRLSATGTVTATPGTDTTSGLWGVIDNPIRSYIAQHSTHLPAPGSAIYTLWQFTGLIGLLGGAAGSTGARLLWTGWGLASAAMVWSAAPDGSRTIATGTATLMWALASIVALRGLSPRRLDDPAPITPQVNIYPAFYLPPQPTPYFDADSGNIQHRR